MILHPCEIGVFGGVLETDDGSPLCPFLHFSAAPDMDSHGVLGELTGKTVFDDGKAAVLADLFVENKRIHMYATMTVVGIR